MDTRSLYLKIITIADFFLRNNACMSIQALQDYDPSLDELAKIMRSLANMLKDVAAGGYEDEAMAINAFQCCLLMERLADVVKEGDEGALADLIREFEMHVNVP
jgi:hypothetical protein